LWTSDPVSGELQLGPDKSKLSFENPSEFFWPAKYGNYQRSSIFLQMDSNSANPEMWILENKNVQRGSGEKILLVVPLKIILRSYKPWVYLLAVIESVFFKCSSVASYSEFPRRLMAKNMEASFLVLKGQSLVSSTWAQRIIC
jgi:hypothetical protein